MVRLMMVQGGDVDCAIYWQRPSFPKTVTFPSFPPLLVLF